jgi:hypothetical protein
MEYILSGTNYYRCYYLLHEAENPSTDWSCSSCSPSPLEWSLVRSTSSTRFPVVCLLSLAVLCSRPRIGRIGIGSQDRCMRDFWWPLLTVLDKISRAAVSSLFGCLAPLRRRPLREHSKFLPLRTKFPPWISILFGHHTSRGDFVLFRCG